jgi:hypothetical protein
MLKFVIAQKPVNKVPCIGMPEVAYSRIPKALLIGCIGITSRHLSVGFFETRLWAICFEFRGGVPFL